MKKIVLLGLMGLLGCMGQMAYAQFDDYGIKVALGTATIKDDLSTKAPLLGLNVGGYLTYSFKHSPTALAEIFYLQSGVNLIRRGSDFEEVLEHGNTLMYREGFYHSWYVQVPVLAGVHFELPIREPGHVVGFYLGPAVSYGLFGRYADRKISPGVPSAAANYDVNFNGSTADRQLFNHINRLDVSAIFGITYERGKFVWSIFVDHGFIATSEGTDVLRILENQSGNTVANDVNVKIPNGSNNAVMLSLSYKMGTLLK